MSVLWEILSSKEEMIVSYRHRNWLDDTTMEFPRFGFWIIHIISCIVLFVLGMRFALRRAPLPFVAYRLLRRIMRR